MAKPYNYNLRKMYGALEGASPGTAATLENADFDVRFHDVEFSDESEYEDLKAATGEHSLDIAAPGDRKARMTGFARLIYPGTPQTPPKLSKFLQACGMKETVHGTAGVSWHDHTDQDNACMTLAQEFVQVGASPKSFQHKLVGAMGNFQIMAEGIGKPIKIPFDFLGKYPEPADLASGNGLVLTSPDEGIGEVLLSATVSIHGVTYRISRFEFQKGNNILLLEDHSDVTGWLHGYKANHDGMSFSCDLEMQDKATDNIYTKLKNGTTGTITVQTTNYALKIPVAQYREAPIGNRNGGAMTYDAVFRPQRNGTTDNTFPASASVELLQKAKS